MIPASVLVLSHDRPALLQRSVASALAQTVEDLEVLIVGDGVTDAVRASATELAADPRVRFLDYAKGSNRGESNRDLAIRDARSNAILYLCDDDLFMPTHVESMLELLETNTFAQPANCWIDENGQLFPYAADLASEATIARHLRDDLRHNAVSITGTAHRRDFYLEADLPWAATPDGFWPDHWQWRRMMGHPSFSGATSPHATALQFPHLGSPRAQWAEQQRAAELDRWLKLAQSPTGQTQVDALLTRGALRQAEHDHYEVMELSQVATLLQQRIDHLESEVARVEGSLSWKVTAPLRSLRRRL